MKKLSSKFALCIAATFLISGCAALKNTTPDRPDYIQASVDLVAINDDKVQVQIAPPKITQKKSLFTFHKSSQEPMSIPILVVL